MSSTSGTSWNSGAIAARAATVIDASGRRAADVGDRRQRHDGVAQPVRREDDQTLHRVVRSDGPVTNERTTIDARAGRAPARAGHS